MTDDKLPYSFTETTTALGVEHEFHGPGLPRFANGAHFIQPLNQRAAEMVKKRDAKDDAERICRMLAAAYEAGREAMAADVRRLIGAKGRER